MAHKPVLLQETLNALMINPDGIYLDGTFGRGGHSTALLSALTERGRVFALDKDPDAIHAGVECFSGERRFNLFHASFAEMGKIAELSGIRGLASGVLLDLGVSSPQLDQPQRGFSFMYEGPLDMRFNPKEGVPLEEWLACVKEEVLAKVLWFFGEERQARRIARAIVRARDASPITTTTQLAHIIASANPAWEQHKHPATRSFLALRIFINQELSVLIAGLQAAYEMLAPMGKLAVISFHSLEDRIVKRFMKGQLNPTMIHELAELQPHSGVLESWPGLSPDFVFVDKPIKPSQEECRDNPRARSALLRVAQKRA